MANGVRTPTQIPTLLSCFSYPEQRRLVSPEWGSGLLTEVIAPQRDPRIQLQRPGEEVGKWNPHRSDCAAARPHPILVLHCGLYPPLVCLLRLLSLPLKSHCFLG